MRSDPIVDEIRCIRGEYAKQFGYDLRALVADLRKRERQRPEERLVSFAPKRRRRGETG